MTGETALRRALGAFAAIALLSLVLGHLLGQPILLAYVATGSMEPTLSAGDGFVAIPSVAAGDVEEGDIVVFDARELHDGGLTTHRVVEVTEEGYVTKGDANPFTDQDGGEPPVTDGQIVAVALTVDDTVVTIPHLGTAVLGAHGLVASAFSSIAATLGLPAESGADDLGSVLVGLGVALLGFGALLDRRGGAVRSSRRSTARENVVAIWVAIGFALVVLVTVATAAMVLPAGVTEYGLVSTDDPSSDPQVVAPGETAELTRTVDNAGLVPVVVVIEPASSGVAVDPDRVTVGPRESETVTVSLTAPDAEGRHVRHVEEHRYVTLLPPSSLERLHAVHPLVALAAVHGVIVGGVVALVLAIFGKSDLRIRSAGDHVPLSIRLRRKVRRWR